MSKRDPLPASDMAAPVPAAEDEVLSTEYRLNNRPAPLLGKIVVAALAVLGLALADYFAVFRLMSEKLADPLTGQPTGDTAGLVAISLVTVVGYGVLGALIARKQPLAKAAALAIYATVLGLIGTAVAPVEISTIRQTWESLTGGGGGFGANSAEGVPAWFVVPCLALLTVGYSLFGIALVLAEQWLSRLLAQWRLRTRALATLDHAAAARADAEERQRLAAFIAALETPATATALRHAALRRGLDAYRDGVAAQAEAVTGALADARTTKAEKQHLAALFADAGTCLNSIPTTL